MDFSNLGKKVLSGLLYSIAIMLALVIFWTSFEESQDRVDRWEAETGRYGEGLR